MTQTLRTRLDFPGLNNFLDQLHSRWSPKACAALCTSEPRSNGSAATFAVLDREYATLCEIWRTVDHAMRTVSASVGYQRNRYSKINELPSEILRDIFLSACDYGLRWKDLASIIRTCKSWYNILIHDPFAYSTIDMGKGRGDLHLAKTFATRSAPLPLNIAWVDTDQRSYSALWVSEFCGEHIARIKTLEYGQSSNEDDYWLLDFPAPQLEQCRLLRLGHGEVVDISREDFDFEFSPSYHVIPYLFDRNVPKLHTLDLYEIRLAWCAGNYVNLTHIKITFHPELLTQTSDDNDCVTIIFRGSPCLEHVELTTSFPEKTWAESDFALQGSNYAPRPRCVMRHLHTIRLHLSVLFVIYILRAIEVTPAIRAIDLRCGSRRRAERRCLKALDTDVLPDFLFANLQSLSFCDYHPDMLRRSGAVGSGILGHHKYSLLIHLPLDTPTLLADKITSERHMLELRHLGLPVNLTGGLMKLLAASPAVDEVSFLGYPVGSVAIELGQLLSDPQHHLPLSRISRWALFRSDSCFFGEFGLQQRDTEALKTFFRLLPSEQRTLSVDNRMLSHLEGGLAAARELIVDLARLNVVITERVKFDYGNDHDRTHDLAFKHRHARPVSVGALWPDGDVPAVVQEVIQEANTKVHVSTSEEAE